LAFFADASGENPNCMSIITDEDWSLLSLIMMPLRSIVVLQGEKKTCHLCNPFKFVGVGVSLV
jgi:hypothetical protein